MKEFDVERAAGSYAGPYHLNALQVEPRQVEQPPLAGRLLNAVDVLEDRFRLLAEHMESAQKRSVHLYESAKGHTPREAERDRSGQAPVSAPGGVTPIEAAIARLHVIASAIDLALIPRISNIQDNMASVNRELVP